MGQRLLILALVSLTGHELYAQSGGAEAEALFEKGRQLLEAGKVAESCAAFDASEKLEPAVATVLNQANCRELNGQLATAWGHFLEAERLTRSATDADAKAHHDLAVARAARLQPRLSTLIIHLSDGERIAGLEILRDGIAQDPAGWGTALPVDGGKHEIEARAPGHEAWSATIEVATEKDARSIDVPVLAQLAPVPSPTPGPTAGAGVPRLAEPDSSRLSVLPFAVGAGVLLASALTVELWARSAYDSAQAEMIDQHRRDDLEASANQRRYVGEGLAVAGVACVGVALWLYVRDATAPAPTSSAWFVAPAASAKGGGLTILRRF